MQRRALMVAAVAASALFGCSAEQTAAGKPDPALLALETRTLPADSARTTFIDFGGKVALVGYELGSAGPASAGNELSLTLYWQASAALEPGWELATEVLSNGKVLETRAEGALRGGADSPLGPSAFRLGRLYKDELTLKLPDMLPDPEITLAASVRRVVPAADAATVDSVFRLPVLSGPSDGEHRGVIAHLPATVTEERPRPKASERRRPSRRRDGAPAPSAASSAR